MNYIKKLMNQGHCDDDLNKKKHPKGFTTIGMAIVVLFSLPFISNAIVHYQARGEIYANVQEVPQKDLALVLGAAAWGSELSPALRDRVDIAIELYKAKKVDQLIMSGGQNETEAMRSYAIVNQVLEEDILEDPEGLNTLASIKNLDSQKTIIIVSQAYHLPRALFMARHYGLEAVGVSASLQEYEKIQQFKRREFLAIAWTVFDLWLLD